MNNKAIILILASHLYLKSKKLKLQEISLNSLHQQ
jgi:hypothetical protein